MSAQKGFSLLLVMTGILALLVILTIGFIVGKYTSNKDINYQSSEDKKILDQPKFQVFTHPTKGFSFEYPIDWITKRYDGDSYGRFIDFFKADTKMMSLKIEDSAFNTIKASYPQATETSVGGIKGLRGGNKIIIPLGSTNSSAVILEFTNIEDQNHLIETLKFSEQSQVDNIDAWLVYEDKDAEYSFPYPPIFEVEKFSDDFGNKGVNLIYENPAAAGVPSLIPPKIVLEAKAIKTSEQADAYANKVVVEFNNNPQFSNYQAFGVTQDQLNFKPAYKAGVTLKNTPPELIGYWFVNLENSVLQIKAYYPNTGNLLLNNQSILYSVIYKIKFLR